MPPNEEMIVSTRKGTAFTLKQWENVKMFMPKVQEKIGDKLEKVELCETSESHQNQIGSIRCDRGNPNGFHNFI